MQETCFLFLFGYCVSKKCYLHNNSEKPFSIWIIICAQALGLQFIGLSQHGSEPANKSLSHDSMSIGFLRSSKLSPSTRIPQSEAQKGSEVLEKQIEIVIGFNHFEPLLILLNKIYLVMVTLRAEFQPSISLVRSRSYQN